MHSTAFIYTRDWHPEETQSMLLLPWLHSLPMPYVAGMRATGCSEIQRLPCSPCSATALCWEVGATSAPVNHKPWKAGQAKRAHSFPLCWLTVFFKTFLHNGTKYLTISQLSWGCMFSDGICHPHDRREDTSKGCGAWISYCSHQSAKVACACLSNDNAEGSGEESPRNRTWTLIIGGKIYY